MVIGVLVLLVKLNWVFFMFMVDMEGKELKLNLGIFFLV